jgi:murein lipoprotein
MSGINRAVRAAAVVVLGALSLGACASKSYVDEQMATVNSRIDSLDARVQAATQNAGTAATDARTANQRLDQIEGRMNAMEQRAVRTPRG